MAGLFTTPQLTFAETINALVYVNPFSHERLQLERRALGPGFSDEQDAWRAGPGHRNRNLAPLLHKVEDVLSDARARISAAAPQEITLYKSLLRYRLYYEHEDALYQLSLSARRGALKCTPAPSFETFRKKYRHYMAGAASGCSNKGEVGHLWAISFQLRRAFEEIFLGIVGASEPASGLRAQIWESVFTHDMRRYERSLFDRMHLMNTLIVGPSGTGKELVARAIGLSRFVPFDEKTERFVEETHESFLPLNVSALSANLIESELFGHKKGSFTGATSDRAGFLERCPEQGTVFLDEIGELSEDIQVKLLRTLQVRELTRIGEHKSRRFSGKLVTATNRDLAQAVAQGSFREDFFYRLRADQITTPTLRSQLADHPEDLRRLVAALCARLVPAAEVASLVEDVVSYIEGHLAEYSWPGNVRELEQSIVSFIVHGAYEPAGAAQVTEAGRLGQKLLAGEFSMDELSDLYVTLAYKRFGSFSETARVLELDRRTVKSKVNLSLISR